MNNTKLFEMYVGYLAWSAQSRPLSTSAWERSADDAEGKQMLAALKEEFIATADSFAVIKWLEFEKTNKLFNWYLEYEYFYEEFYGEQTI